MTGRNAKVSVIVPVYNVEKYLRCCLNSCICQTLYDIEIICVNDGSTDGSLKILREFAGKDPRFLIVDKPNGGLASARNAGMDRATGEILMFLDSDDYLAANACERVWRETLEAPTDIVIFGTEILPEYPRATQWYYNVLHIGSKRYTQFSPRVLFRQPGAKPFVWRQAFSRKLLEQHQLRFDETVKYGEDTVFQLQAFPHARNFSFISDRLYCYRWCREGSLMSGLREDMDEKLRKHQSFVEIITAYWKQQGWLEQYGMDYVNWILEFLVVDIRSKETRCKDEHLKKLYAHLREYGLDVHLNKVPWSARTLVRTLRRGK